MSFVFILYKSSEKRIQWEERREIYAQRYICTLYIPFLRDSGCMNRDTADDEMNPVGDYHHFFK